MSCSRALCAVVIFMGLMIPAQALAVEFVPVGPRSAGMGGAGVAVTTDAYASYWNPAGLAMVKSMDIRIQGTGQATGREDIVDALDDLNDFNPNDTSAANQAKAQDIANKINRAGATISGLGSGGLYFKGHFGEHAFGFNVSDVTTSGAFVSSPVQVTTGGGQTNLTGRMALQGLEARQAAFSYAYAFADKTFAVGVTGKIIQGARTIRRPPFKAVWIRISSTISGKRRFPPRTALISGRCIARPHGCDSAWSAKILINRPSTLQVESNTS